MWTQLKQTRTYFSNTESSTKQKLTAEPCRRHAHCCFYFIEFGEKKNEAKSTTTKKYPKYNDCPYIIPILWSGECSSFGESTKFLSCSIPQEFLSPGVVWQDQERRPVTLELCHSKCRAPSLFQWLELPVPATNTSPTKPNLCSVLGHTSFKSFLKHKTGI